jgi:hypothetical protein
LDNLLYLFILFTKIKKICQIQLNIPRASRQSLHEEHFPIYFFPSMTNK